MVKILSTYLYPASLDMNAYLYWYFT